MSQNVCHTATAPDPSENPHLSAEHSLRLQVKVQGRTQTSVVQDDSTSVRPQEKKRQPKSVLDKLFDSDSEHSTEDDNDRTDVFQ